MSSPLRRRAAAKPAVSEGHFRLLVAYENGASLSIAFDAFEEDDSDPGRRTFGGFVVELVLSKDRAIQSLSITDKGGEKRFAHWDKDQIPRR